MNNRLELIENLIEKIVIVERRNALLEAAEDRFREENKRLQAELFSMRIEKVEPARPVFTATNDEISF